MAALIEAVHLGVIPADRCHLLNPVLFEVAVSGDAVATDIVRRQAQEVVALAAAAIRRLGLTAVPVEVLLGGGVLTAGHAMLMDTIDELLHEQAPLAVTRVVTAPLIVGAALLGLDRIGATDQAAASLRAAYGTG
jgi:N-acetylglucosamine kinase-like BadF-type ATPase